MNSQDYRRIEQAMQYMERHSARPPALEQVAAHVGLSRYHFQRLFTRWAGISPGRFQHCLTLQHAKGLLADRHSLLDAALDAGLSGPGRLHDLFVTFEAISPGEYKRQGAGLQVRYGFHASPFGECLVALTERGVCGISFVEPRGRRAALDNLRERLPRAGLEEDARGTVRVAEQVFGPSGKGGAPLHLLLHGTNFQVKVWEALLRVPSGEHTTYQEVAQAVGKPKAARAVGQAVGSNSIAFLIPCHRVIRKLGVVGEYRWGTERKRMLLAWEAARSAPEIPAAVAVGA